MTDWQPAFAQPLAQIGTAITKLGEDWVDRVSSGNLGKHPYSMAPEAGRDAGSGRDAMAETSSS